MDKTHNKSVFATSSSRETTNSAAAYYSSNYSAAYVGSVSFSREEMNEAYAKARSQERTANIHR